MSEERKIKSFCFTDIPIVFNLRMNSESGSFCINNDGFLCLCTKFIAST